MITIRVVEISKVNRIFLSDCYHIENCEQTVFQLIFNKIGILIVKILEKLTNKNY